VGGLGGGCGGEAPSLASCRIADAAWGVLSCSDVRVGSGGGSVGWGVAVDARSGGGGVSPSAAQRPPESLYLTL
jgi:hypothetical protein